MKTNELTIGDWVSVEDTPTRVTSVSICIDNSVIINTELYNSLFDHDVNHIPLTEEILKANGWIQSKYSTCSHLYEYKSNHLRHAMIKRGNGRWVANVDGACGQTDQRDFDKSYLRINVYFVHELQHALRLCGLNELADNFKIE